MSSSQLSASNPADRTKAGNQSAFGRGFIISGFSIIAAFACLSYLWLTEAPIQGSVVAPGVVNAASNVQTVQHLEGGIVSEIMVQDGDRVSAGQVLIRLQDTASAAGANEIKAQWYEAKATEARLIAERDGRDSIDFPEELRLPKLDNSAADAIAGQESVFRTRRHLVKEQISLLQQTTESLKKEIEGFQGQVVAARRKLEILDEQVSDMTGLYQKKLVTKSKLLELQREKADVEGAISGYVASIGAATQKMEETRFKIAELGASKIAEIVQELGQAKAKTYEQSQRLAAAEDIMARTEIRAPIAGTVLGLKVHTKGGVVEAGDSLMEIVPVDDAFVVMASIDPLDIDQVMVGLPATIWLSSVNRRYQQPITGDVRTVSADRLIDPRTGLAFYSARVTLQPDSLKGSPVALQAGMSVQVMIETGERSAWEYLSAPVYASLGGALRE